MTITRAAIAGVVGILLAFASPAFAAPPKAIVQMQEQMLAPTVQIDGCSAQIIYSKRDQESGDVSTYVLTAKHCIRESVTTYTVRVPVYNERAELTSEKVFYAKVHAQDYAGDSALLILRDTETWFQNVVKLAPLDSVFYEGEETWAVGYPMSATRTMTMGNFVAGWRLKVGDLPEKDYFRSTADIAGGSSGGGLYHKNEDGDYELIGTATAASPVANFMTLWTPIHDIQAFLKRQAYTVYKDLYPADAK